MAHIVSCMVDAEGENGYTYIPKPASPQPPNDLIGSSASEQKPYVWRMHHPETRKYQLFPKDRQPQLSGGKGLDPEQAFALAMGQTGEKTDKTAAGNGLRLRIKEHNLNRRRKVSVPELGPMTTVHEVPMDSPTIPGRPPLHERSISAPGNSWRQHHLAESVTCVTDIVHDENAEFSVSVTHFDSFQPTPLRPQRQPLSPKQLAPLVIPAHTGTLPRLARQLSLTRLRSGSTPSEPTIRSARTDDSPKSRTPYTPLTASTAFMTPMSASTAPTTALPTPISAPIMESRSSPKPWERPAATVTTPNQGPTEPITTPKTDIEPRSAPMANGHRRGQSESGSIMERGRPRKRMEVRNNSGTILKRADSKRSKSAERRAFEVLPSGWKASDAMTKMNHGELASLQQQAFGQASRFEVLKKEDVEALSRELRHLDERTEYLRRTYTSLRAGRRNLHSRICQYLRSPRVAKFSTESMLKQEEALGELDTSIDDWVTKLEQAENRRTRVRQKLLEHVAAAATLPTAAAAAASESLQLAMGIRPPPPIGVGNISTPPRSPVKISFTPHTTSSSPSPQRVVAQVPSTIMEQPLVEEVEDRAAALRRADVESIRIYADSDVYALLADVENEFTKMSAAAQQEVTTPMSEDESKQLHRARSQELLNGLGLSNTNPRNSPAPPSPPLKASPTDSEAIFLTSAVFRPAERTATA